jgi:HD-GYP domain-containing protein (c-di-GMP phosphodiesterase class II)
MPALTIDLQQPAGGRCQAIASQKPVIVDDMASKTRTVAKTRIGNDLISDSAIYTPMIVDGQVLGLLELQSYRAKAYQAEDGKWLSMAANQIGLSIQNARLFDGTLRRVKDLEAINHISVVLRTITKQDQMLAIVLEETLKALDAEDGAIELWDKSTNSLKKAMARGWPTEVTEPPYTTGEGIAGRVFTSGENYISRDFANDPVTRAVSRSQLPPNWGGICVPIRSAEHTLGTLLIAIPSERELNKDEIRLLNTLAEMTGASLQRMRLYEEAIHRMQDLQALREVDQAITSNFDLRPTLDTVITHVIAQLGVEAADILLLRPHLQLLEYAAGQGFRTPLGIGASVRMGDSLAGRVALERHTLHISNLEGAQANADFAAFWKSEGFASYFCVPLLAKGEVKGVLEIYQRNSQPPDPEWINYLETLAGQAAIAIDITQLFDKLQRANLELGVAYETTIESWSRALSLRDSETEGHTQRVTEMITILAQSFNYHGEALQHIRRGAILHDIGKMGVPDQILLKPGPLTDEEWVIMRKHPQLAYDMLKPIAYLHNSLDIPYYHHEKWDGTGYPHKLAGDNIPLAARIFAIVDVYDALTSDRPYRKAWSKEKAVDYIREQNGKHFDPQVVEAFLREFGK